MIDDPYLILGVERGTPVAEIKRAYRRLVKANHPDSAGPTALPRFLAIQAAYEEVVEGRIRPRDVGAPSTSAPGPAWRADPERARATRENWRRRSSRTGSGPRDARSGPSPRAGGGTGSAGRPETADAAGGPGRTRGGGSESGPRAGSGAGDGSGRRSGSDGDATAGRGAGRPRNDAPPGSGRSRATPGSTSYDGADREPFDPAWGGASWYGPSSGTYWTINAKEYADPRKHGPEYQARARRAKRPPDATAERIADDVPDARTTGSASGADRAWPPSPRADVTDATAGPRDRGRPRPAREAGRAGPDLGRDRSGRAPRRGATSARGQAAHGSAAASATAGRAGSSTADGAWAAGAASIPGSDAAWSAGAAPTPGSGDSMSRPEVSPVPGHLALLAAVRSPGRLLMALTAWPPVGLAAALLYGELTGCARFSVECADATTPWPWIIQLMTLAVFLLLPRLTRIAVVGTYAALIVVTPLTLFLMTGGRAGSELAPRLLFGGLALAWIVGIGIGLRRRNRPSPFGGRVEGAPPVP